MATLRNRRRLLTAVSLSLGFHAVLLAVISQTLPSVPSLHERQKPDSLSARIFIVPGVVARPAPPEEAEKFNPNLQDETTMVVASNVAKSSGRKSSKAAHEDAIAIKTVQDAHSNVEENIEESPMAAIAGAQETAGTGLTEGSMPGIVEDSAPVLFSSISPDYPMVARRFGVEGVVVIDVIIDQNGQPADYHIQPPRSNKLLEKAAIAAAMNAEFNPAIRDGFPVQGNLRLRIRFELGEN